MRQSGESLVVNILKKQATGIGSLRRLLNVANALILVWICAILWGERLVFRSNLAACQWHHWEKWPSEARPHRVVLIADPQLVDPHTYPGRPWPLSSLTIFYTDLYLRRSYTYLQKYLQPDTLFFLGDLFDGGREWGTWRSTSVEERYKRYDNKYWMKEYTRFQRIFIDGWLKGGLASPAERRGRKIIASLPGNHDLGFASGIQRPVKDRFEAYFGDGNRIDIIGNHSFLSVDTVSLSAMDEADLKTGSSGAGDGTSHSAANRDIWASTAEFLSGIRQSRDRAVKRELRILAGLREQSYVDEGLMGFAPEVADLTPRRKMAEAADLLPYDAAKLFPSILLTHVPLYRPSDTDCGGRRERGHAIAVQAGYQYQNVLTPLISKDLISKIGVEDVRQVYSGDDHDFCEVEHGEFTGRIKEITVKSISWAMGVRKPGFLAVSLHNPVNVQLSAKMEEQGPGVKRDTIQNHLCLLPDQLAIFVRYGMLLLFTLLVLAVEAVMKLRTTGPYIKPLLPLSREKSPPLNKGLDWHVVGSRTSSLSSSPEQPISTGASLAAHRTPRAGSPKLGGYGNLPSASRSSSPSKAAKANTAFAPTRGSKVFSVDDDDDDEDDGDGWGMPRKRRKFGPRRRSTVANFGHSFVRVAVPVLAFYTWLVRRG